MPGSHKHSGHHHHHKPAGIPAKQRTNGRVIFALLFVAFGVIIAFFATEGNIIALVIGAIGGALIGYFIGKSMEREASSK